MNKIIIIGLVVIAAVWIWYFYGRGIKSAMDKETAESVVITGIGRYTPHVVPVDLGGGFKEWGKTPDGDTVISKNDPSTYQPWEWQ